jgi:Fic family protein
VAIAALVAFGFVFIHPFGDGNGRIHRFLIHQVLSTEGFTPSQPAVPNIDGNRPRPKNL